MVRTLPWLKERPKNEAASVRSKTVKTPNPQDLDSEDDAASTTGVSPFKRKAIARAGKNLNSNHPNYNTYLPLIYHKNNARLPPPHHPPRQQKSKTPLPGNLQTSP